MNIGSSIRSARIILQGSYISFLLLSLSACTGIFFYPDHAHRLKPSQLGLAYEDINLQSSDGTRLHAWLLPALIPSKGTVLFLHGNAQNISTHIMSVAWLPAAGYNVLALDYRGYGLSQGRPDISGALNDIEAAAAYIAQRSDLYQSPLIILGQSLGGALAITAAARLKVNFAISAVISDSAFSSYRLIAREKFGSMWLTWLLQYPLSMLFADDASPRNFVNRLSPIPLLIIHGESDNIVPKRHAQLLFDAALEPKELWIFPGTQHIQALFIPNNRERLQSWLDGVVHVKSVIPSRISWQEQTPVQ